jgi:hypothetical protein
VDQLIEGMLAVGPGLAPIDCTGVVRDGITLDRYVLAVTLHGQLLQVGGESFQVLLVRQYGDCLRAEKVAVPHGQQPHKHG